MPPDGPGTADAVHHRAARRPQPPPRPPAPHGASAATGLSCSCYRDIRAGGGPPGRCSAWSRARYSCHARNCSSLTASPAGVGLGRPRAAFGVFDADGGTAGSTSCSSRHQMTTEKPAKNGHSNTYIQLKSLPDSARLSSNPPAARQPQATMIIVACSRRVLPVSQRVRSAGLPVLSAAFMPPTPAAAGARPLCSRSAGAGVVLTRSS
jgi:hypothetical protein